MSVQNQDTAGFCLVFLNRFAQILVRDILQLAVDGQNKIFSVHWLTYRPDIFDNMAEAILDDTTTAL